MLKEDETVLPSKFAHQDTPLCWKEYSVIEA